MTRRDLMLWLGAASSWGAMNAVAGESTTPRAEEQTKNAWQIKWSQGPPYPAFIKGGAMAAVKGAVVYAAGIAYPWRETETGWYFEPDNGWKPLPPMPMGRAYTSGTGVLETLAVVGGRWKGHACKEVFQLLRPAEDQWRWETLPSLSQARSDAAVAAVDSLLVAVGGGDWDRTHGGIFLPRSVTMAEGLDLEHKDKGWRPLAAFPGGPRAGAMAASAQGKVYAFGGYDCWYENERRHIQYYSDAYSYDPVGDHWEKLPNLPVNVSGAAAATLQDRYIAIAGGVMEIPDGSGEHYGSVIVDPRRKVVLGQYSDRVIVYDTVNRNYTWARGTMPRGPNDLRLCVMESRSYALGGENVDVTLSNTVNDFMIGEMSRVTSADLGTLDLLPAELPLPRLA